MEEAEMMGEEGRGREKGTGTGTRARAPARAEPHNRTDSHVPADLPGSRHSGSCRLVGSCVPGSDLHPIHSWKEGTPRAATVHVHCGWFSGRRAEDPVRCAALVVSTATWLNRVSLARSRSRSTTTTSPFQHGTTTAAVVR